MAKNLSREQRLAAYLDEMVGGRRIDLDKVDPDLRAELEFAARILANRDEAPQALRAGLKSRLLNKIAQGACDRETAQKEGFWEKIKGFGSNTPALRIATGLALVLLVVVGGVIWVRYSSRTSPEIAMAPAASRDSSYALNLPANNAPANMTVSLQKTLSTDSGETAIYRVESPHVTSESVKELGKKLGFRGEAAYEDDGKKISMYDGSGMEARQLTLWVASGAVQYGFTDFDKLYPALEPALPSATNARKTAYDFMKKLNLIPPGYPEFSRIQDAMQVIDWNNPATGSVSNKAQLLVVFPYLVDGVQAVGPGARMEVAIGNKGEVLGMLWAWRSVASPVKRGTISEETAYRNLIQGQGSVDVPSNTSRLNIEEVDMVYWIEAYTEPQGFILPVYQFKGKSLDGGGNLIEDVNAWAGALY